MLRKLSISLLALILLTTACPAAQAAAVSFGSTTELLGSGFPASIYALSGSECTSLTFSSDYTQVIVEIPAASTFKFGTSSSNYIGITPSNGSTTLTIKNSYFNSNNYITSWTLNNSNSTSTAVAILLSVEQADRQYCLRDAGSDGGCYGSGPISQLNFYYNLTAGERLLSTSLLEAYRYSSSSEPSSSSSSTTTTTTSTTTITDTTNTTGTTTETVATETATEASSQQSEELQEAITTTVETPKTTVAETTETTHAAAPEKTIQAKGEENLKVEIAETVQAVDESTGEVTTGAIKQVRSVRTVGLEVNGEYFASLGGAKLEGTDSDLKFSEKFTLTIPFDTEEVSDTTNLNIYRYDPVTKTYIRVDAAPEINAEDGTVSVEIDELGIYSIFDSAIEKSEKVVIEAEETKVTAETSTFEDATHTAAPAETSTSADTSGGTTEAPFVDVETNAWYTPFVDKLAEMEIMEPYPDGSFRPDSPLRRFELIEIAVNAFGVPIPSKLTADPFSDVPSRRHYAKHIAAAQSYGMISQDSTGKLFPQELVSRAEALKILLAAAGLLETAQATEADLVGFSDVDPEAWYAPLVTFAESRGVITGHIEQSYTFAPAKNLALGTYSEDVGQLQRLLQKLGFYNGRDTKYLGPLTESAVIAFQNQYPETQADGRGVVGSLTAAKIAELSGTNTNTSRKLFKPNAITKRAEVAKMAVLIGDRF